MKCDLCQSSSIKKYLSGAAGDILKCAECDLVFLSEVTRSEELEQMYSEDYFLEREDYFFKDGVLDASGVEKVHIKDFREGLDWIESYKKPPGKLLDLGCAMGSFLSIAQKRGWECYGVEISDYAAGIARDKLDIQIFNGMIRDAGYPNDFFDVITLWDIIEHLPDPLETLTEVHRVLKASGILIVNTPNEDSLIRKVSRFLYRGSAGMIKSPINRLYHCYHIHYFNTLTLSRLLNKIGLQVINSRRKVIPISRGRGSPSAKAIVKLLSLAEKFFHKEYELFFIAQKSD